MSRLAIARRGAAALALLGSIAVSACGPLGIDIEKCGPEFRDVIAGNTIRNTNSAELGGMEFRLREERNPTVHRLLWVIVSGQGQAGDPLRGNITSIKLRNSDSGQELFTIPLEGEMGGDEVVPTKQIVYPDFIPFADFRNLMLTSKVSVEFITTVQGSEQFTVPLNLLYESDWDREICQVD